MPDAVALTADDEAWLGGHILLVADDLDRKHREMAGDRARFLRGTYYLWLLCLPPAAFQGPDVPGVGDLHVDNFGTWQDARGVRRWGVNDLDELAWAPYALDRVRLATARAAARSAPPGWMRCRCRREPRVVALRGVLAGRRLSLHRRVRPARARVPMEPAPR